MDKRFFLLSAILLFSIFFISHASAVSPYYSYWDSSNWETNLTSWYHYDNDSSIGENSTYAVDVAGGSSNGTITSAVFNDSSYGADGLNNSHYMFDGASSYIETSSDTILTGNASAITVSFWAKRTSEKDNKAIYKQNYDARQNYGFRFQWTSGGLALWEIGNGTSNPDIQLDDTANLGTWHHYVGTYEKDVGLFMYIDGVQVKNGTDSTRNQGDIVEDPTATPFIIGVGSWKNLGQVFNGSIDEVIIWKNRRLSDTEVSQLYDMQSAGCVVPYEDMTITEDTTLCSGTYYLNDTNSDGAIIIGAYSVTLDCNGAILQGNYSSNSKGVYNPTFDSVTVKNCVFNNYTYGIEYFNGCNSGTIENNTIENSDSAGMHIRYSSFNTIANNTIIGNPERTSGSGFDIDNSGRNNFTNNNITNSQYYAYWLRNANTYNNTIEDGYSYDNYITVKFQSAGTFNIIDNLTAIGDERAIDIQTTDGIIVINSNFSLGIISSQTRGVTTRDETDDINITNTIFTGTRDASGDGYGFIDDDYGSDNIHIEGSVFDLFGEGITITGGSENITVIDSNVTRSSVFSTNFQDINTLNVTGCYFDEGDKVGVLHSTNFYFIDSDINNMTTQYDNWLIGLSLSNVTNFKIDNANITDAGQLGIMLRDVHNGVINNTYIDTVSLSYAESNSLDHRDEPAGWGIGIVELYKHYSCAEGGADNSTTNYTQISLCYSNNITIENITFGSNIQLPLRTQGTTNLTHDITGTWNVSFKPPYLTDVDNFYISNSFNNLTNINPSGNQDTVLGQGIYWWNQNYLLYEIKNNQLYFKQDNDSLGNQLEIYDLNDNQTKSLVYVDGGNATCTDLSNCNGNISTILNSNAELYALQNINLTEGVTRDKSPFWVVSRSDDGKTVTYHLGSNLTNSVDGLDFYPLQTIKCGSASFTSNGSSTSTSPTVLCSGSYVNKITLNDYRPSSNSNVLTITYGSGSDGGGGGSNVGGQSGSNSTTDGFYNRTFLCGEAQKFIEFYTKNGEFNYTLEEYNAFKNKIVLLQSFGIEDAVLKPFIDDFPGSCPDFIDEDGNPINLGGSSDGEGFNYTYLWIALFVLVILIVIILIVMGGNAHKDRTMLMAGLFQRNKYDPSNP